MEIKILHDHSATRNRSEQDNQDSNPFKFIIFFVKTNILGGMVKYLKEKVQRFRGAASRIHEGGGDWGDPPPNQGPPPRNSNLMYEI